MAEEATAWAVNQVLHLCSPVKGSWRKCLPQSAPVKPAKHWHTNQSLTSENSNRICFLATALQVPAGGHCLLDVPRSENREKPKDERNPIGSAYWVAWMRSSFGFSLFSDRGTSETSNCLKCWLLGWWLSRARVRQSSPGLMMILYRFRAAVSICVRGTRRAPISI